MKKNTKQDNEPVSVFFKISKNLKTNFNKSIDDTGINITQTKAIERLLEYFSFELSDERRKELLRGSKLGHDPDHLFFDILGVTEPAEHFFQSGFYVPSIEFYERVLKKSKNLPNLKEWANYKLGYCWNSLAENRREEAYQFLLLKNLKESIEELELSVKCIDQSISYYKFSSDSSEETSSKKFILRYNVACAYSQKCQYYTELAFLRGDLDGYILDKKKYSKSLSTTSNNIPYNVAVNIFNEVKKSNASNPFSDKIRDLYDESIEQLKIIYRSISNVSNKNYNISWLTENMLLDSDLGFIRESKNSKPLFEDIHESLTSKGKTVRDWCLNKLDLIS